MKRTGAEIIMECLLEQQVDTVFGYPGGAVLNIYDALYKYSDRINHILTAHEQGAAHAADGYARATGKVGVCIATSGPGATNLVTGIATAYMDSVPMVAITGNVNRDLLGLDSFQEVDITGITMPITKHNYIVKDVSELAQVIREAFQIAMEGRRGPVFIDIPKDITSAVWEYTPEKPQPAPQMELPPQYWVDKAVEMMAASKQPMIYAGGGLLAADAAPQLAELARRLDAPVSCSLMCQGGFDQLDDRYMGMLGMHGTMTASLAIKNCDLMVVVGSRFSDRVTCNTSLFAQHFPVIQIDIDAAEFNKNVNVDVRLKGDAREILDLLLQKLEQQAHPQWMAQVMDWKAQYPLTQHTDNPNGITPKEVLETLSDLTDNSAIITTEVGQHQMWAAQYYRFRRPRQMLTSGGLGTMGYGLGASLGAQVALPDQRVINIAGDGSFHMNANELSTAAKYNIPIIELIFNNEVLGMVRQWQKLFYDGRFSQTTLDKKTNYELLAEAYGVKAMTISSREEIRPVLEAALALREPVLINCHIDRDINVLPMVPAGASVEDPILEM